MPPRAFISWSSGKDCAFALWEAKRQGLADIVGVLTTLNETFDRVAMHGVRHSLLDKQIAALGLPAIKVLLPWPCSNGIYEVKMAEACAQMRALDVEHIVFGDLFLRDIRAYREDKLRQAGMTPIFPLWDRPTPALAHQMIDAGFEAHLACIDPRHVPRELAGRRFDASLLADLPDEVDPCGENGEFHTVVTAAPIFSQRIPVTTGETVERDGFVYTDIIPQPEAAAA